jgi:hypothetical protein
MKFLILTCLAAMLSFSHAEEKAPTLVYELRIYTAAEGKLDALKARFRDHTVGLFQRHGMTNVAYWTPIENPQNQLIYLLSFPSEEARKVAWKGFGSDPEWKAAAKASEVNGKLLAKPPESRILTMTDFSPEPKADPAGTAHTFEMRTYTTTPGNLPLLLKRFREHTVDLFTRHGMKHFAYFTPAAGQPGAEDTLVYFLMHDSPAAHEKSFAAFRADPEWIKAKAESETAGGGSLTIPDGVKSVLMTPMDFSPVK